MKAASKLEPRYTCSVSLLIGDVMNIDWKPSPGVYLQGKLGPYTIKRWPPTDTEASFAIVDFPSEKDESKTYSVLVTRDGTECTCPSFVYRPWNSCKHRNAVERLIRENQDAK